MARAIELDDDGNMVLTDGLVFGQLPGRLNTRHLNPGDVLVWYSSSPGRISAFIREFSRGPYSHVGIYLGNGYSIDAGPEGVKEVRLGLDDDEYAQVMRKISLTVEQQEAVVSAARKFIGYRYAWFDAITLPLRRRAYWRRYSLFRKKGWINGSAWLASIGSYLTWLRRKRPPINKIFCSQLVVEAYSAIDYFPRDLVEEGVFTPNDLAVDNFFNHEGWLCKTSEPVWHLLDLYSPEPVRQRRWRFSIERILRGKSTGGK
ncbi:hypothetical protein RB25_09695 [Herbaspirillum rubrisubalbicans]|nr:hypothetical protein RB25_09695 [Herbaspirillum rubrisubalbicans]